MDYDSEVNNYDGPDMSPEEIALALFMDEPKEEGTYQILTDDAECDPVLAFEILCTILLEAMDILTQGLTTVDLKKFDESFILQLNPWFKSMCFKIDVDVYDKELDKEFYKDYYCSVKIRTPLYETFFIMKNIDKNYHFLLNGNFLEENQNKTNINDLSLIFINDDKVYKITFDFHIPSTNMNKLL